MAEDRITATVGEWTMGGVDLPRWRPVSEKPSRGTQSNPDLCRSVLLYPVYTGCSDGEPPIDMGFWTGENWVCCSEIVHPTHWMYPDDLLKLERP